MPHVDRNTATVIRERWPRVLLEAIDGNAETRAWLRPGWDERLNDFRGVLAESETARYIADHDHIAGISASLWARNLNRWLTGERVPGPEMVRATLAALGADWIVGLGETGYQQHALCLIHKLWQGGARTTATAAARAIFATNLDESFEGDRARRALQSQVASPYQRRLDAAAAAAWHRADGEIPPRAIAPADLAASPGLYTAWLMLESSRASHSPATAWGFVQPVVAQTVRAWIDEKQQFLSKTALRKAAAR